MELRDKNLEKLELFSSMADLSEDDLSKVQELSLSGTTFSRR